MHEELVNKIEFLKNELLKILSDPVGKTIMTPPHPEG